MYGAIGSTVAASCRAVSHKEIGRGERAKSKTKEEEKGGEVMDMETILEETVATEDLKKFEQKYHTELNDGKVDFS